MRRRLFTSTLALLCCHALLAQSPAPRARQYAVTLDAVLAAAEANIATMTAVAGKVANRLLDGGTAYIGGSMKGFRVEGYYRAGGTCLLRMLKPDTAVKDGDVVLYGILGVGAEDDPARIEELRRKGALVVLFGSDQSPAARAAEATIPTGLPGHGLAVSLPDGRSIAPLDGVVNVANLWAFTGELVAAATRLGKMPTMYQSVMIEGARDRNKRVREKAFHDDLTIAPIPAGRLAQEYLAALRGHLRHLRETATLTAVAEAAAMAADAKGAGHRRWAWMYGHYPPSVPGTPGDPGGWEILRGRLRPEKVKEQLGAGDVLLCIYYCDMPLDILAAAREAGAKTFAVVAGTPDGPPPHHDAADLWIDPGWVLGDAELAVDGYDVKILPPSGAIQTAIYWMLVAETAARD